MGDKWDYKLRKMEIAWELAKRVMPEKAEKATGKWTEGGFLRAAQSTLQEAWNAVDAVFTEDKSE